ncbi:MAG: lysoplasmalogenase family protein [Candidatus Thorarchaeota archaeon]
MSKFMSTPIDYLRAVVIIAILVLEGIAAVTGIGNPYFLGASITMVVLALVNYLDFQSHEWSRYALFFFIAMICGSIGDFLMADIFRITPIPILNGIILFGIGHVFYALGLRERSNLLFKSPDTSDGRLIAKNIGIWAIVCVSVILLFILTVFNPSMIELGFGMLGYGLLLGTVLGFAITKWFEDLPISYKLCISVGFLLFLFSDWLIGYHIMTDASFLSGPYVGLTYIFGQLLLQLSVVFGGKNAS